MRCRPRVRRSKIVCSGQSCRQIRITATSVVTTVSRGQYRPDERATLTAECNGLVQFTRMSTEDVHYDYLRWGSKRIGGTDRTQQWHVRRGDDIYWVSDSTYQRGGWAFTLLCDGADNGATIGTDTIAGICERANSTAYKDSRYLRAGNATAIKLLDPKGCTWVADTVYFAEFSNNVIRAVNTRTGRISTTAGQPGMSGSTGDGGNATAALLYHPTVVATSAGNLYLAGDDGRVRKIDRSGMISAIRFSELSDRAPDTIGALAATRRSLFVAEHSDVHRLSVRGRFQRVIDPRIPLGESEGLAIAHGVLYISSVSEKKIYTSRCPQASLPQNCDRSTCPAGKFYELESNSCRFCSIGTLNAECETPRNVTSLECAGKSDRLGRTCSEIIQLETYSCSSYFMRTSCAYSCCSTQHSSACNATCPTEICIMGAPIGWEGKYTRRVALWNGRHAWQSRHGSRRIYWSSQLVSWVFSFDSSLLVLNEDQGARGASSGRRRDEYPLPRGQHSWIRITGADRINSRYNIRVECDGSSTSRTTQQPLPTAIMHTHAATTVSATKYRLAKHDAQDSMIMWIVGGLVGCIIVTVGARYYTKGTDTDITAPLIMLTSADSHNRGQACPTDRRDYYSTLD